MTFLLEYKVGNLQDKSVALFFVQRFQILLFHYGVNTVTSNLLAY